LLTTTNYSFYYLDKYTFNIARDDLFNRTGLFYVGVGERASLSIVSDWQLGDSESVVIYDNMSWAFMRNLSFAYTIRPITKGCYYFMPSDGLFENEGIEV